VGEFSASVRRRLFSIDASEVDFVRRGFRTHDAAAVEQLEISGGYFVTGYNAALADPEPTALARTLESVPLELRGFAFEGAGMALALLDALTPWSRDRFHRFLAGPGEPHSYMVIIGAGWALARLRLVPGVRPEAWRRSLDPVLGWLLLEGYGFHEAFFHPKQTVEARARPRGLQGYERHAFDQGVGRCLWFVCGAGPEAIDRSIAKFAPERRSDLWAGVGLACCYAGGVELDVIDRVALLSGAHRASLAQGAAFAARARQRAHNPTEHTRRAVERIGRMPFEVAAKICDSELAAIDPAAVRPGTPAFELWRGRIRGCFERAFHSDNRLDPTRGQADGDGDGGDHRSPEYLKREGQ